jgi:hypothetical protein
MPLSTKLLLGAGISIALAAAVGQAAWAVDPEAAAEKRNKAAQAAAADEAALVTDPVDGEVTLGFRKNYQDLTNGEARTHTGVDIKAPKGAAVVAAGDGVVVEATERYRDNPNWGTVVVIDHGHGLVTRYAHLDSFEVKKGDRVKAGDRIASVGATGKVTGPHLHFEALRDGKPVNPKLAMAPSTPEPPEPPEPPHAVFEIDQPDFRSFNVADGEIAEFHVSGDASMVALEDDGVFAWMTDGEPAAAIATPRAFAFVDGEATPESVRPLESMLEDILAGREDGEYDLSIKVDGERLALSSEEPLTDAEREKLRSMLKSLKTRAKESNAEMRRALRLAEKDRDRAERARRAIDVNLNEPDHEDWRLEALEAELGAIDSAIESLREFRNEAPAELEISIAEALADLSEDRADISADPDIDEDERLRALEALDEAREQLRSQQALQSKEVKSQLNEIDRELAKLKARRAELLKETQKAK